MGQVTWIRCVGRWQSTLAACALALLGISGNAEASFQDCVLSIDESSPVRVNPAGNTTFNVRATEGPAAGNSCFSANYSISKMSDTTLSPGASTPSGGSVSVGTAQPVMVNMPYAGPGAGSVVYQITCSFGCEESPMPPLQFRVDVKNYQQIFAAPTPSGVGSGTINTNIRLGGQIQVDGANFPTSAAVNFQQISGPSSGTFTPGGSFGNTNADGSGGVQIDFQAPMEGTYQIRASADNCALLSSPGPAALNGGKAAKGCFNVYETTYTVNVQINRTLSIDAGNNLSGQSGESATISVRALDDGLNANDTINWSIVNGAGSLSQSSSITTAGVASNTFNFGATPGPVTIRATRVANSLATVDFTLENYRYNLVAVGGSSRSGVVGSDIGFQVRLDREGTTTTGAGSQTISWTQSGPGTGTFRLQGGGAVQNTSTTDGAGIAAIDFNTATQGSYTIDGNFTPPSSPAPVMGSALPPIQTSFATTVDPMRFLNITAGNGLSGQSGESLALQVRALDGTNPASDTINWSIISGAGSVTSSATATDASGNASTTFNFGTTPGPVTIRASRASNSSVTADFTLENYRYNLVAVGGSSRNGVAGSDIGFQVRLDREGTTTTGAGSQTISWTQSGPSTGTFRLQGGGAVQNTSNTDGAGIAAIDFNTATQGAYTIDGNFTPPPSPAPVMGSTLSPIQTSFATTVDPMRLLNITAGNGLSGQPGESLALQVTALDGSNPASDTINWSIVSGAGSVTNSATPTDASGNASTTFNFGATPGPVVVRAERAGFPSTFVTFNLQNYTFQLSLPGGPNPSGTAQSGALHEVKIDRVGTGTSAQPGATLNFNQLSGPSGGFFRPVGGGASTSSAVSDSGGVARLVFVATTVGSYATQVTHTPPVTGSPVTGTPIGQSINLTPMIVPPGTRALQVVSGNGQSARANQDLPQPLVVQALDDGSPPASPVTITFSASPASAVTLSSSSVTTDSSGNASINVTLTNTASGAVTITAVRSDAPTATAVFTVNTIQDVLALTKPTSGSGDGQTGAPGETLQPLRVVATNNGSPASGVVVNWSVTGPGSLSTTSSTTNAAGEASINVTLGPDVGTVNVIARRNDAGSVTTSFVLTSALPPPPGTNSLRVLDGNMQTGLVGSLSDRDIVVELLNAQGIPLPGETINWDGIGGGATPVNATSTVDANGRSTMRFRFGSQIGTNSIRASHTLSGLVADSVHTALASQVTNTTGNGSSGNPGQTVTFGLQLAPTASKGLGGVIVSWEVQAGGGTLANATTTTNAQGQTENILTLGSVIGTQTVRATAPGGITFTFTAQSVAASGQLAIASGNNQSLTTNTPSAPLVVRLLNQQGQPVPGATIAFATDNASVDPQTAVTDAQGRAQTIARVTLPGAATVTASTDALVVSSVTFSLIGSLLDSGGNPGDGTVEGSLNLTCSALAAIANRSPAQEDLYQRCLEFSDNAGDNPDDVGNALNQLPTPVGGGLNQSGQDSIGAQLANIDTRFDMLRYAQSGGAKNAFNIGFWTPDGVISPSMLAGLGADESGDEEVGADFGRWGFFATGTIGRGEYDGTSRRAKFDYDIAGLTAGVDYRFRDNLIGGLALGYTSNDADLANDLGSLETTGWSASAYLSWYSERQWYVDSVLSYGNNSYELKRRLSYSIRSLSGGRTVIDQVASADTDGDQSAVSIALGRDFQKGPWSLNSYLRGSYARVTYDTYTERMIEGRPGQGLALQVDGRSQTSITSALGGRATYVLSRDWGILMPTFSLEWQREFEDDPTRVTARFAADPNSPTFFDIGEDIDNSYFNVGVGVSALFPGGKMAYLHYEQLVGASRLRQGVLSLGVRIEF